MSTPIRMTSRELKEYAHAKQVFKELLDDFNARGLLRKGIPQKQIKRLAKMWGLSRRFGRAYNAIFNILGNLERTKSFFARNKDEGIDEQVLTYSFVNQAIGFFLYEIETVFKTSLLFFLEKKQGLIKRMQIGPLLNAIKNISPNIGTKLKPLIDLELRNSLAHGAFWFEAGGKVFITPNSHLEKTKDLELHEFFIRVKKQNIVAHALIKALVEKVKQGYFR